MRNERSCPPPEIAAILPAALIPARWLFCQSKASIEAGTGISEPRGAAACPRWLENTGAVKNNCFRNLAYKAIREQGNM